MKKLKYILPILTFILLSSQIKAQTSKDIQGTWRVLSTIITNDKGEQIFRMDSATHNLTKIITLNRVTFTIYNKKTDSLEVSGQGKAATRVLRFDRCANCPSPETKSVPADTARVA